MENVRAELEQSVPLQGLLGYLNFSEGRPDPRFQKQLSDCFSVLAARGLAEPHSALHSVLAESLEKLHAGQGEAFRDIEQARAVLDIVFKHLLPAYRAYHADLLRHQGDADLYQPFFLARVFEGVLAQRGPWNESQRIVQGCLKQLNDYVGHRPVAILETRPKGEPYDHERVRPIPIFLRGAGAAWGKYQQLIEQALAVLEATDANLLRQAYFDPSLLDELAFDPRAYDFGHPVEKRPNYCFGEWDPHHIDNQGRFRRFVVRQVLLDALLEWTKIHGERAAQEVFAEAAAVLAGTILMASGISGSGPGAHDSSITLGNLVPRIAQLRDAFYAQLLDKQPSEHRQRLRGDVGIRQPFGAVRQHLNHYFARQRAMQLQQRHLALLFARLGYPDASRRQAAKIAVTSTRILTEIHLRLATGQLHLDRGDVGEAARLLPEIEDLLERGIACGALVDPWNILGFQNQFPRFISMEDSVRDHRIDELTDVMQQLFHLYARVLSEGAARGEPAASATVDSKDLLKNMRRRAKWWDRFATLDVSDVTHINGGQEVKSAEHVAGALAKWRERGSAAADLAFWREQHEGFHTPKGFALVVDALLQKEDFRAAMALLMTWLENAEQVPLEEGEHSFHTLALRWMLGVCKAKSGAAQIITKFLDYLEANADEFWNVPRLDIAGVGDAPDRGEREEETESLYSAAYENVTFQDSTDDDVESEVLDIMPQKDFDLTAESERLEKRLQFTSTVARLWNVAVRGAPDSATAEAFAKDDRLANWHTQARENFQKLLALLDRIHEHEIPKPSGAYDSLVEYDRRRGIKDRLLGQVISTALDTALAVGALEGAHEAGDGDENRPPWQPLVLELERCLRAGDAAKAQEVLPKFMSLFRKEPLLYAPVEHGGHPRAILRASLAQAILRSLVANLPRLGLVRDTFELIRTAREMERDHKGPGPRVTEFDRLCTLAGQAVADTVVEASRAEPPDEDLSITPMEKLAIVVEAIIEPFLTVWLEHSKSLRVSVLEMIQDEGEWKALCDFIRKYGKGLFTAKFLTLANLRAVLHQGVGAFLNRLREDSDPQQPLALVEDLDQGLDRTEVEKWLNLILQTLIENYEEYRDYNTTTTQSDYGENLSQLFEFLRLKAAYERHSWMLRLLFNVHETLARRAPGAAKVWRDRVEIVSKDLADEHLKNLAQLEKRHGVRLRTIRDRLEDRFLRPLDQSRLVALVAGAMEQAKTGHDEAARVLEKEIEVWAANPVGVGLDVPQWIGRLEGEIHRVHNARSALVNLAERVFQVPRLKVPLGDLYDQVKDWNKEE